MKTTIDSRTGKEIREEDIRLNREFRDKEMAKRERLFREMGEWDAKYRATDKTAGIEALRKIKGVLRGNRRVD